MKTIAALCLAAVVVSGCSVAVPFKEPGPATLGREDPRAVVEGFRQRIPDDFHLLSTIVFEYNWFSIAGLGYVDITPADGRYKVACLNLLGVKLFEFEGDRSGLTGQYVLGPLAGRGNVARAVATDIQRIYLDLLPSADARVFRRKAGLVFRQRSGDGALEYLFAGGKLASKTYREDERAVWRASYYEYAEKNGKLFPMGIVFSNFRHGYRLIVRQKEILD